MRLEELQRQSEHEELVGKQATGLYGRRLTAVDKRRKQERQDATAADKVQGTSVVLGDEMDPEVRSNQDEIEARTRKHWVYRVNSCGGFRQVATELRMRSIAIEKTVRELKEACDQDATNGVSQVDRKNWLVAVV